MYRLDERKIIDRIKDLRAERVILQLPNGLRQQGFRLARLLEAETGVNVYLSADPCYGACDLPSMAYQRLRADLIVNVGHSGLPVSGGERVIFIEGFSDADIKTPLLKAIHLLRDQVSIGLASTIQHIHLIEDARQILERAGKKVLIGEASGRARFKGQVLGCDYSTAKQISDRVEAFIILAGGVFHGLGLYEATGKRTIVSDPYTGEAKDLTEAFLKKRKRRMALAAKFLESKKIAVILGLKTGQMDENRAMETRRRIEDSGKESIFVCSLEITPENLNSFTEVDIFVNTACPRIASTEREGFIRPIVNVDDIEPYLSKE